MLELIESEEILEVDSTYDHGTVLEEGLTEMLGSFKRP
jgi:hypothetical protein